MTYVASWNSIRNHVIPQWLKNAKFGIYAHWGVYSVPACGPNGTWYPYQMYRPGNPQYDHHVKTYGPPEEFGYKDFIPMFTAEHFDAEEWAELFKASGARFAGPVAEHHDGFSMWDSEVNEWNAARMGPKRDVVGELAGAIRKQDMRFMVAMHHAENHWFYNHDERYDTVDPRYAGLYGAPHDVGALGDSARPWIQQERPDRAFLDQWLGKLLEVVDNYQPDLVWFDDGINLIQEHYKREFLAYYYNQEKNWGKEVVVTYKDHDLVPGAGLIDLEQGSFSEMTHMEWLTDTTVDNGNGWCFLQNNTYKSPTELVHYLIDNVSKNGHLLLNVDPMPNGQIPEPSRNILNEIGRWLEVNGEAIYGTTPWIAYGEGPTRMQKSGGFSEDEKLQYTPEDFRFTCKDDVLYATCMAWPGREVCIHTPWGKLYPAEIASIRMLGDHGELKWRIADEALHVEVPDTRPCDHAYVFKISRKRPF